MTDAATADILESILRLYPDPLGGSLSLQEAAHYLHTVHGVSEGSDKSAYEVIRRNLPRMGIKVTRLPGLGQRIWVSHLVGALDKLRYPKDIVSKAPKGKTAGFRDRPLDYRGNRGQSDGNGRNGNSSLFVMVDQAKVANPNAWHWRPQPRMPIVPKRTSFVSEFAAIRYENAQNRSQEFWSGVFQEMSVLLASERQRKALSVTPAKGKVRAHARKRA
jgi:hypothetical protein